MKQYFSTLPVLALAAMGVFAPNMKADEWNRKTSITINHAIEVEGTVLPAGSYVLNLVDLPANHQLVRILNAEESRVMATVFTVPIYRQTPPYNSEFNFYEAESGRPPALHSWFYPGDPTGFEFRAGHGTPTIEAAQGASTTAPIASSN